MAVITVFSTPQFLVPVYNDSYLNVGSSYSIQPQFNFIFDIYTGMTSPMAARIISPASPDGSCYFSPFSILKDYIGYDLAHDLTGWTASSCCAEHYKIGIGIQYSTGSTIVQVTDFTFFSGLTWNAAARYEQFSTLYNYNDYLPSSTTGNFMTNMPDEVSIQANEMASISVLGYPQSINTMSFHYVVNLMQIVSYQISGGTRIYNYSTSVDQSDAGLPGNVVQHFGSGIWNLNALNSGNTTVITIGAGFPVVNPKTDYKYTVQVFYYDLYSGSQGPMTKLQTYVLDTNVYKYSPVRLMWLNPLGVFDYFTFKLVSRLNDTVGRNTYKQNLSVPQYNIGDRGVLTTYNDIQEGMTVNTDWNDDDTSIWLEDLFNSPEVYMLNPDGTIYPITLIDTATEIKRYQNDRELTQYTINFNFAYKVNVQQGSNIRSTTDVFKNYKGGPHNGGANYQDRGGYPINIDNTPF